ncbi:MAG: hypothetical protein M0R21_11295 [Lentimicrobiaceae bacterium]|nr:hypothetical protein [Lentimicrobiaceae bacterium]
MKTKFENTLNSTEAVLLLLTNNAAVWSVIAAIATIFDLLKAKVQLVRDLRQGSVQRTVSSKLLVHLFVGINGHRLC